MPLQATGDCMTSTALVARPGDPALAGPLGSLDAYLERVSRIAVLDRDEERALAERFRSNADLEAARQLVLSHLRFVVHIARGYSGYGLPVGDLIQEGNVGLMKAVKRFDPTMNVRLVSFAVHWIRAEIHEYVLRNWRLVKVATTKAQRKLFFNLRRMKKNLTWLSAEETAAVANPADTVEDEEWDNDSSDRLQSALGKLDDRSRKILQRRFLTDDKATLHELADEYHVSAERIRQIEANALTKLRGMMAAAA